MPLFEKASRILQIPRFYQLIHAPIVSQKIKPFLAKPELLQVNSVLELGCGPGMNARFFERTSYTGIDLSEGCIEFAKRRHAGRFITADVVDLKAMDLGVFDLVFANSLFHHLSDRSAMLAFEGVRKSLSDNGVFCVLDLVLPRKRSVSRALAVLDRGDFPRYLERWKELLGESFHIGIFEPYAVRLGPVVLWNMFFCTARNRVE